MNRKEIKAYIASFLFVLASMLIAMVLYNGIMGMLIDRPVITPVQVPFKVFTHTVSPGGIVSYEINYFKRIDIPGTLCKQLIVKDKKTGKEYYLPLDSGAGHLPTGIVYRTAFVKIPDWSPQGTGRIKISSMHHTGRGPQFSTAYTEEFEVTR